MATSKQQLEDLITQIPEKWHSKAIENIGIPKPSENILTFLSDMMEEENVLSSKKLSVEKQNAKLKEDIAKLQKEKAELTKSICDLVEESEVSTKKARENEQKHTSMIAKLNSVIETLQQENSYLKTMLESKNKPNPSDQTTNNLKAEIEILKKTNEQVNSVLKATENINTFLKNEVESLNKLLKTRGQINEVGDRFGPEKIKELEKDKAAGGDTKQLTKQLKDLQEEKDKLATMNEYLTAQEKKAKLTLEEMVKKNAQLIDAQDKFETTIEKLKKENQAEKKAFENEKTNMQKLVDSLLQENEKIQDGQKKGNT
eukprot:CAMPEP_0176475308 /NCGR_PEP_ID=MMETSP0127-20121128/43538_1 /TAXON_ID=938130 /ORGANISM="Platyophrya macrostoma, Strain WH" /LENGTH=314 /DNA_ID=CAMNT_0017870897 /DNA_START=30 /DNA_END=970 /DNA_ORIENTATION=+